MKPEYPARRPQVWMLVAMFWIVVFVGAGWLGSFGPPWTREWVLGFVCMASLALLAAVETWRGKR